MGFFKKEEKKTDYIYKKPEPKEEEQEEEKEEKEERMVCNHCEHMIEEVLYITVPDKDGDGINFICCPSCKKPLQVCEV